MSDERPFLEVGKTLSDTFQTIGTEPGKFAAIIAICGVASGLTDLFPRTAIVGNIISFVGAVLAIQIALKVRLGPDAAPSPRIGTAFRAGLLSGLGALLGFVLLIVPGFMLLARWQLCVPALMHDADLAASAALGRSAELTKGNRWRILGLFLVIIVPMLALVLLFSGLAGAFSGAETVNSLWFNVVLNLLVMIMMVVEAVSRAVAYQTLSGAYATVDGLAEVFA